MIDDLWLVNIKETIMIYFSVKRDGEFGVLVDSKRSVSEVVEDVNEILSTHKFDKLNKEETNDLMTKLVEDKKTKPKPKLSTGTIKKHPSMKEVKDK